MVENIYLLLKKSVKIIKILTVTKYLQSTFHQRWHVVDDKHMTNW